MNLSTSVISVNPAESGHLNVNLVVSGPGIAGTMNLTVDPTIVSIKGGSRLGTDMFAVIGGPENVAAVQAEVVADQAAVKADTAEVIQIQSQDAAVENDTIAAATVAP